MSAAAAETKTESKRKLGGESQDEEEEEERVSDGKETEAKWGRENREKADWLAKQTPKNNSETLKCLHGEKVSPVF